MNVDEQKSKLFRSFARSHHKNQRSAMQHQSEIDGRSSVGSSCSNKSIRDVKNFSASDAENSDFYLNESDEEVNKHEFEDESGCEFFLNLFREQISYVSCRLLFYFIFLQRFFKLLI